MTAARLTDLRCAGADGGFGVPSSSPALSWSLASEERDVVQLGYRIQVADEPTFASPTADTGDVDGDGCIGVPWPGTPLASRQRAWWRVRATTSAGDTGWSRPVAVEASLLDEADWAGRFVGPGTDDGADAPAPCPRLRRAFDVGAGVRRARLYVTSLGLHEVLINGRAVTDEVLAPGWTTYRHRLPFRVHDVTGLVVEGPNVLAATLADGWYRGYLGWEKQRCLYGRRLGLLAQLEVELDGGERLTVATDDAWRWSTGPLLAADLYDGESFDARLDNQAWATAGFDDGSWAAVDTVEPEGQPRLEPAEVPPVRRIEALPPAARRLTPEGSTVLDFGQNIAGWVRLEVRGPAGAEVILRHAEVLDESGRLYTRALRNARATDRLVLAGTGDWERYEPRFTFHGFRFAEVTSSDPSVVVGAATAVVVSSDLPAIGSFACSNELVNRLQANIVRSQRGNFISVPTDCPQRDERMGWTGDADVFAPTACFNLDSSAFLAGWLRDLALDQDERGGVPPVIPDVAPRRMRPFTAAWGDAATLVPWALYEAYGDPAVLRRQYPSMRSWVESEARRAGEDRLWTGDFQFGDWLDPDAPAGEPWRAKAPGDFVATAYLARSAAVLARTAAVIGEPADEARYSALASEVRDALWAQWGSDVARASQTACALSLVFDLAPRAERAEVAAELARLVTATGGRIATGFVGTPLVCQALADEGHLDAAYELLLSTECPSWLYPVLQGATSIWERWDAIRPDGRIHTGELGSNEAGMLSFNHYAYGAVGAWLYRAVAGLAPDPSDPGYHHILVRPRPGGGVRWATAGLATPYGRAAVRWWFDDGLHLSLEVPANTSATVELPTDRPDLVRLDGGAVPGSRGVRRCDLAGPPVVVVGSGRYEFVCGAA
ncbi:MAG TPA: family 78 glycoside hydrolase catalytic domain [Acidimicrobiales bacterium]|nr:family 78 glycoside hydrolase catalytic domain [Acidimicrobiales bacterium]